MPAPCRLFLPFPSVSHIRFCYYLQHLHFWLLHFYAWDPEARRSRTPLWRRVVLLCLIFSLLAEKYRCCHEVVSKISVAASPSVNNGCILLWFSTGSTKQTHADLPIAVTGGKLLFAFMGLLDNYFKTLLYSFFGRFFNEICTFFVYKQITDFDRNF